MTFAASITSDHHSGQARFQGSEWPIARRVLLASCVGTVLEYYDFFIYGPLAALVFGKVFFPRQAENTALLLSLSTFAIGFIARPIGAALGGHWGDRHGRKRPLLTSIVVMGLATFTIGCLPTFTTIGIWASVALVLLRFVQGVALGSEWGGPPCCWWSTPHPTAAPCMAASRTLRPQPEPSCRLESSRFSRPPSIPIRC